MFEEHSFGERMEIYGTAQDRQEKLDIVRGPVFAADLFHVEGGAQALFETNMLDQMLSSMEFLVAHFRAAQLKYNANPCMMTHLLASWFKFDKYYKLIDDSPVYVAAILLHPSLRQAYL